jgi:hypothetical protein
VTDEEILEKGTEIMQEFIGWQIIDVFGVLLSGLVVAARKLGMTKIQVQEIFVKHWDATK